MGPIRYHGARAPGALEERLKRAWQLERIRPDAHEIGIRNPTRSLRWLWALVAADRQVSIAGCRVRYTRFGDERGERQVIEKKIPGGKRQSIAPGGRVGIGLGQPEGGEEDPENGPIFLAKGPGRPEPFRAAAGDTIEIYDDRGNLAQARVVMRPFHPVHRLNAAIWHTRTWFYNQMERFWSNFQATGIWMRASSMAYNTILVVVPFAILLLLLFAKLDEGRVSSALERMIVQGVSAAQDEWDLSGHVPGFLLRLRDSRVGFTMYLFGLFSTVLFMMQVGDHLNEMRGSPPRPRTWWRSLLVNFLVFPGVVTLGYLALKGIVVASGDWADFVANSEAITESPWLERLASAALYVLVAALLWVCLCLVYYFVPTVRPRSGRTWFAALIAAGTMAIVFSCLALLTQTEKFGLFGPFKIVAVALFGCYLGWAIFFLGAFWAYSDRDYPPADPKTGAVHIRFGILMALQQGGSQTIHQIGERIGVDPALVWTEALAMQNHGSEENRLPPVRVGICSQSLDPRISLEDSEQDLVQAALGSPDLLSYLHGSDPDVAKRLRLWLRRVKKVLPPSAGDDVVEEETKTGTWYKGPHAPTQRRESVVLESRDA